MKSPRLENWLEPKDFKVLEEKPLEMGSLKKLTGLKFKEEFLVDTSKHMV